ncbi:hypothetical protein BH20ACT2_BH20ACT2_26200 [soil metagenome]
MYERAAATTVRPVVNPSGTYWDEIARRPDGLPDGWRRHARRQHLALLQRWLGPLSGRWLKTDLFEEPAEHRALLPHLRSATWVGTDLAAEVVRQAKAATACRAAVSDVRALPFDTGAFDGVLSTSTLDHFADPADLARSVGEIRRVLRPGGRLVLTLDNPANPLIRLRNALPPRLARRTGLVPFAVGHTLAAGPGRALLEAHGFTVDAVEHLLHAPHVVGTRLARFGWYERGVLPHLDGLATTRAAPRTGHFVALLAVASAPNRRFDAES